MDNLVDTRILRSLREARGWNQDTLAREAKVHPSVISRLERGLQQDLDASVLVALAHSLNIPCDTLLSPQYRYSAPELEPSLAAMLTELAKLPNVYQRQVAALLRAYISSIPEQIDSEDEHSTIHSKP